MGIYGCLWLYGCLWVLLRVSECLWVFTGVMDVYGCLWGFMGFWVSMDTYGCHKCLWVLYLKIKNIAQFLIQEPHKRLKSHMCYKKMAYAPQRRGLVCFQYSSIKSLFSPLVHNILF